MPSLSSALMALAGPLAKKVLASLGIGVLTFTGLDIAVTAGLNAAKASFTGISVDIASLLAMSGFFTACSVIAGGITAGLVMMTLSRFAKLT